MTFVLNVNYDWSRSTLHFMFIGSGVFTVYGGKVVSISLILDIFKVIVAMRLYGDFFLLLNYMGNRSTLT